MLISHKYNFIFVHIWKTGGNSIRDCLKDCAEDIYPLTKKPLISQIRLFGKQDKSESLAVDQHITFKELKVIIENKRFNQYYKFAFVRNPLDLIVSHYHFINQHENHHPQKARIRGFKTFEDYIKWSETNEMVYLSQKRFVYDDQNILLADFIGRYEHFQESFNKIQQHLGINNRTLHRLNNSQHDYFMKYYNSTTEEIVRSVLSEDFRLFNY